MTVSISLIGAGTYFALTYLESGNQILWYLAQYEQVTFLTVITGVLYVSTSLYGMYVFFKKMYKLIKLRAGSTKSVMDETAIKLNITQTKLMNQASKYVSLLSFAILSSFVIFSGYAISFIVVTDNTEIIKQGLQCNQLCCNEC